MAVLSIERQPINLPCPTCGQVTVRTIEWIRSHHRFVCAGCNATIALNRSGDRQGRRDALAKDFARQVSPGFERPTMGLVLTGRLF